MSTIEFFFQDPTDFNEHQSSFSTLFLLRRDILTSFGINPNDNSRIQYQVLFPGTMAIMAGIDLLSKFHFTDSNVHGNKSGDRFKGYVSKYIDCTNQEILYQLRNSLLHSFGLYSKDKKGKEYNFILLQDTSTFISTTDNRNYYISILNLLSKFDESINNYKADLLISNQLRKNFSDMFTKYGQIGIPK
ncbi:MAG: hypothetical protein PHT25_00530 [Bacteroidales bacterium]|nr:hypothetical protein [Bacteroidales bacterium]